MHRIREEFEKAEETYKTYLYQPTKHLSAKPHPEDVIQSPPTVKFQPPSIHKEERPNFSAIYPLSSSQPNAPQNPPRNISPTPPPSTPEFSVRRYDPPTDRPKTSPPASDSQSQPRASSSAHPSAASAPAASAGKSSAVGPARGTTEMAVEEGERRILDARTRSWSAGSVLRMRVAVAAGVGGRSAAAVEAGTAAAAALIAGRAASTTHASAPPDHASPAHGPSEQSEPSQQSELQADKPAPTA